METDRARMTQFRPQGPRSILAALAAFAISLSVSGCDSESIEVRATNVSAPPLYGAIQGQSIELTHGNAMRAHVSVYVGQDSSDDREAEFEALVADPKVLTVSRGPFDKEFVFVGVSEGKTEVTFTFRGDRVAVWTAKVLPQNL